MELMFEQWWRPESIKYTRPQIDWLLNHLDEMKQGKWPPYPKGTLFKTDAPLLRQDLNSKETQEKIVAIAKELEARMRASGLFHEKYGFFIGDDAGERFDDALRYMEGEERKRDSYKHWKIREIMEKSLGS